MRKVHLFALILLLPILFSSCATQPVTEEDPVVSIYATCYPIYALTRLVVGDAEGYSVHCLMQPQDECLRGYTLSDWDQALLLNGTDVVIAAGQGLESYGDVLESMAESHFVLVETLYGFEIQSFLGIKADEDSHFSGGNPFVFLSTEGCEHILTSIAASLETLYPDDAETFKQNETTALERLSSVSDAIVQIRSVSTGRKAAILNEALLYPANALDLDISCVIQRESGEMYTEKGVQAIIETITESGAAIALIEKQAPAALIQALEANDIKVVRLDTMSAVSDEAPEHIFDILLDNTIQIKEKL